MQRQLRNLNLFGAPTLELEAVKNATNVEREQWFINYFSNSILCQYAFSCGFELVLSRDTCTSKSALLLSNLPPIVCDCAGGGSNCYAESVTAQGGTAFVCAGLQANFTVRLSWLPPSPWLKRHYCSHPTCRLRRLFWTRSATQVLARARTHCPYASPTGPDT